VKRWREDPEEREVAGLLAPLVRHAVPPDARPRVWQAVEQRTRAPSGRMRTPTKLGVLVLAVVIAGTATARMLREPGARRVAAEAPPSPVAPPVAPAVVPSAPTSAIAPAAAVSPASLAAPVPAAPPPSMRSAAAPRAIAALPPAPAPPPPPAPAAPPLADAELAAYKDARAAMRGDLAGALIQLSAFLATFPDGRFDVEARISIIECKVRLGRLADAEPDVDAFLARYPDSERAPEIRFARAELQRAVHRRCDRALADYRAASASARVVEDALFFRGWCAGELGDRAELATALREYLSRAPAGRHAAAARALLERQP
jgi:hypothetical protein